MSLTIAQRSPALLSTSTPLPQRFSATPWRVRSRFGSRGSGVQISLSRPVDKRDFSALGPAKDAGASHTRASISPKRAQRISSAIRRGSTRRTADREPGAFSTPVTTPPSEMRSIQQRTCPRPLQQTTPTTAHLPGSPPPHLAVDRPGQRCRRLQAPDLQLRPRSPSREERVGVINGQSAAASRPGATRSVDPARHTLDIIPACVLSEGRTDVGVALGAHTNGQDPTTSRRWRRSLRAADVLLASQPGRRA